ncbi:putative F-box domain, FBD domain, leucine-rich repeat domain superfamily [Helianthus annuus]|nr:putative F-box domain, FBD domain, leucine-rich repeat domain superfamily [Helianthus annuus]
MEYQNPTRTHCLNSDIISTLPLNIIEYILCLMPLRDALRTSVLSKKWRYSWEKVPKLAFTDNLAEGPSSYLGEVVEKRLKVTRAIRHVLTRHNGPTILELNFSVGQLKLFSDFDQIIIRCLSRQNVVKEVIFIIKDGCYNLPFSFFSLQGLERIHLQNCGFELPLTFYGFSRLRRILFTNVEVSAEMLQEFLSHCPLLDEVILNGYQESVDFASGGNKLTFVDLLRCVPLLKTLEVSKYYMKYLTAGGMPDKLPTSLAHLKHLHLDVCFMEQIEISSAICMIRSSPVLEKIVFRMCDNEKLPVQQTSSNFFDSKDYSDLKLDHLETLEMKMFNNLPLEMEFVKLVMAMSPVLKKVRIELNDNVSVDEELKMLKDMLLLPFPRASPSAKLIFVRP